MATDAVAATDATSPSYRLARNPKYEGQRSYTFEETLAMFDFWDVVDIFNPLQHIPIIGNIYRELTGDEIGSFASVAGSTLYGGPIGAVFGMANMVVKESTGKDAGQLAMAAFLDEDGGPPALLGSPPDNLAQTEITTPLGADLLAGGGGSTTASPAGAASLATVPVTVFTGVTTPGGTGAPTPPPASALARAGYAAPLGGLLLASETAQMAAGTHGAATAGAQAAAPRADAVPTLTGAQSAALAAFVAHHAGGGASRTDGAQRVATPPASVAGAEAASRAAVAPPATTDPGQQGQDMPQNETPTMHQRQDQSASRDPRQDSQSDAVPRRPAAAASAPAMPADIQRGRDALRARMAAAQGGSPPPGQGPNQGLGAAAGAAAENLASRPTGMTLADYRDRPVTPAVDADRAGSRSRRTAAPSSINAGDARAFAGLLPDASTMARVLEQGGTVANAVAEDARRAAEGVGQTVSPAPITGGYPRPDAFRAMPVADPDPAPAPGTSETAPVVAQPWFSDRVMDAMRRYDALRTAGDPAT